MDYREGRLLDPDSGRHTEEAGLRHTEEAGMRQTEEAGLRHTDYISRKQSAGQIGLKGEQKARPRKWEGCIKDKAEKYKLHFNKKRLHSHIEYREGRLLVPQNMEKYKGNTGNRLTDYKISVCRLVW